MRINYAISFQWMTMMGAMLRDVIDDLRELDGTKQHVPQKHSEYM